MINQWKGFLEQQVVDWGLPRAGAWNFLFHNNYQPHYSSFNLLWFHDSSEFPAVMTKFCREPILLKREFENLKQVYACAPTSVPQPLYFGLQGGFWSLWMRGVPGLRCSSPDMNSPATLHSIVETVAAIHRQLRQNGLRPDPDRYRRMVLAPLETLSKFGSSAAVQAGCANLTGQISAEWTNALPVIPQHGDLYLSNLLSHHRQWYVVDWESLGLIDLPFYDLLTLLYSLLRAGGKIPPLWNPALVAQVPSLLEAYAQRLELSPADVVRLLPLTFANWFHLQWMDGREEFTQSMYEIIQHYFDHVDLWEKVFLPQQG